MEASPVHNLVLRTRNRTRSGREIEGESRRRRLVSDARRFEVA